MPEGPAIGGVLKYLAPFGSRVGKNRQNLQTRVNDPRVRVRGIPPRNPRHTAALSIAERVAGTGIEVRFQFRARLRLSGLMQKIEQQPADWFRLLLLYPVAGSCV